MIKIAISLTLLCLTLCTHAQGIFRLYRDRPQSFKFEMINNAVLVPVAINGMEFRFLLDTGVKETILFAAAQDSLLLHNQNKITFHGLGTGHDIEGVLSTGNTMTVGDVAIDTSHWIYVVRGEDLDIASNIGIEVNGILGAKFFNSFPIQMDYLKSKVTIYPPAYDYRRKLRGYQAIDMTIENERPYIHAKIKMEKEWVNGKFLLDMGNTDPLMLFSFLLPDYNIDMPYVYEYLGRGFNGPIYGKKNRIHKVAVGNFELTYPIASYPDSAHISTERIAEHRIGSVGNQILQRFHVFFDYGKDRIYLKRNRTFHKPFMLNMAGIDVKHEGMTWTRERVRIPRTEHKKEPTLGLDNGVTIDFSNDNFQYNFILTPRYIIAGIRAESPAARAGVKVGDQLLKVNGKEAKKLSLAKITEKMQTNPGDELRLELQRDNETIKVRFKLIDPIPIE